MHKTARVLSKFLALSLLVSGCAADEDSVSESEALVDADGMYSGWIPGPDGDYVKVRYRLVDGVKLLDGDIMLDEVHAEKPKPHQRAAFVKNKKWPGAVVPYVIGPGFDAARTAQIHAAIKDWNDNTPFWFTARSNQADYVQFTNSDKCWSSIGKVGGMQSILLASGCGTPEIIHEMGHAVGFFHEQSRQDRDSFINIDYGNVKADKKGDFDKYTAANGEDWGPYEVESIMHYPSLITDAGFVKDTTKNTITRKNGTTYTVSTVLTGLDRAAAYRFADWTEPMKDKWLNNRNVLGFALNSPRPMVNDLGRFLPTEFGRVYVHVLQPDPVMVYGAIYGRYLEMGAEAGLLGRPVTDELGTPNGKGRYNHFANGSIYWSPETGAHEVYGHIRDKWASMGWENSFLGFPVTGELGTPDGVGRFNHFQGGSIYWTPATGAQVIYGDIRQKWAEYGWETSFLGYPVTDELGTPDGVGRFNHFQGGSIYWTPATGAKVIYGDIRAKWASIGWETSFLGYPVTDELGTPDGVGRFNHFQGGSIYWTPSTGAHLVYGAIRDKWASMGWETSALGYPTTDELDLPGGGRYNKFQGGTIKWTPAAGAWVEWKDLTGIVTAPNLPPCMFTIGGC
jgi:hypothetical protein